MPQFHVRIANDDLVFSAAHFIALDEDTCEALHGHDYAVAAEVQGPLDDRHFVIDFVALHKALRTILDTLDHRVLLPSGDGAIRVAAGREEVKVTFATRRWVFPRSECLLLPIPSTTTELLARHIAGRLLDELESRCGVRPPLLRIEVTECRGFSAVCQLRRE